MQGFFLTAILMQQCFRGSLLECIDIRVDNIATHMYSKIIFCSDLLKMERNLVFACVFFKKLSNMEKLSDSCSSFETVSNFSLISSVQCIILKPY